MNRQTLEMIRRESEAQVESLGYDFNKKLPLLDSELTLRQGKIEIVSRILCLFCVVAVANRSNARVALDWAEREGLTSTFAPSEISFLHSGEQRDRSRFLAQEESLWAFAWAGNRLEKLSFSSSCEPSLASIFPNLREGESSGRFFESFRLRSTHEILGAVDLSYCLHWAVVEEAIKREKPNNRVPGYVIIERRRALEWLASDSDWDEVELDT